MPMGAMKGKLLEFVMAEVGKCQLLNFEQLEIDMNPWLQFLFKFGLAAKMSKTQ